MECRFKVTHIEGRDDEPRVAVCTRIGGPSLIGQPSLRINVAAMAERREIVAGDVLIVTFALNMDAH